MEQDYFGRQHLVIIGKIRSPFGVKGWLRVDSFTEPKANIWNFDNWFLINDKGLNCNQSEHFNQVYSFMVHRVQESRKNFLVLFKGIIDRASASQLTNSDLAIKRSDLPKLNDMQYYWVDLIGAKVYNLSNCFLGILQYTFVTAANEIMVIKNKTGSSIECLIPYSFGDIVTKVDVNNKVIIVDWEDN